MEEFLDKVAIVLVLLLFGLSSIILFIDYCLMNKYGQFSKEYEKFDRIFELLITIVWYLIPAPLAVVVLFLMVIGVLK